MSERNMGQVVPFQVNAARLRRSAEDCRRRGQQAEALVLLRRAAQQEDTAAGWLRLAEEYEHLGCCKQAMLLLCRLLAKGDVPPRTWLVLGFAMAHLGNRAIAVNCMHHCMDEDPYEEMAAEVYNLSTLLETETKEHERLRLPLLVRRSLRAWENGNETLGERQLRRAIRMAEHPAPLMVQLSMLLFDQNRMDDGLACIAHAVRREPDDVSALCALAVAVDNMGRPRAARGLLQRAMGMCRNMAEEEMAFAAAETIRAWGVCEAFLSWRLRLQPCCIMALRQQAILCWVKHRPEMAQQYWHKVLQLDPDHFHTRAMLRWAESHTPHESLPAWPLPEETTESMLRSLSRLERLHPCTEILLDSDGSCCTVMNWCLLYGDEDLQMRCLGLLQEDHPWARQFLRQVLTHPMAAENVREKALSQLGQWGETGYMYVLKGQKIVRMQYTPEKKAQTTLWRMFACRAADFARGKANRRLLMSMCMKVWLGLTMKQRIQAAGPEREGWLPALHILWLRRSGQEQLAEKVLLTARCPARIINYRMQVMERILDKGMEENQNEKMY